MFDGLLSKGFSGKCKSLIKPTRTRIEVQRRRAEAKQKFLKEDLAKLLANGLDINAYGRTEEFLAGLNLLSNYDYLEQVCDYMVKQLSSIQKLRDCPVECREAVASLMFAAARFSDLPELRDLRDVFQERYGSALEHFVNPKFVEKLSSKSPAMESRIQLLQDIALEFSIKWDSNGFQKRMNNPSAFVQEQPRKYGQSRVAADENQLPDVKDGITKSNKCDVSSTRKTEVDRNELGILNGSSMKRAQMDYKIQDPHRKQKPRSTRTETIPREKKNDIIIPERRELTTDRHELFYGEEATPKAIRSVSSSSGKRVEVFHDEFKLRSRAVNGTPRGESPGLLSYGRPEVDSKVAATSAKADNKDVSNDHGSQNNVYSTKPEYEEKKDQFKPGYNSIPPPPYVKLKDKAIPPPYVKPMTSKNEASMGSKHADADRGKYAIDPSLTYNDTATKSLSKEPEYSVHKRQDSSPSKVSSHGHENEFCFKNDIPLPKSRSVRRKHSKSSSNHDDYGHLEREVGKRSSRRREHSRKGLQTLLNDERYQKDEEEKMIDRLLIHYSKKPSICDVEKLRKKSQANPSHQVSFDAAESSSARNGDAHDMNLKNIPPRSLSLPREQSAPTEKKKVFARASSFQPDNQARHVHPKLPDYDDLAARFAALRGG